MNGNPEESLPKTFSGEFDLDAVRVGADTEDPAAEQPPAAPRGERAYSPLTSATVLA